MYQIPKEYKEDQSLVMGLIATVFLTTLERGGDLDKTVDTMLDLAGSCKHDIDAMCEMLVTHYEPEEVTYDELRDSIQERIGKLAGFDEVQTIKQGEIEPGKEYELTGKIAEFVRAVSDFQFRYVAKLRIIESIELFTQNVIGACMKHVVEDDVALDKESLTYHKMTGEELMMSMFH